MNQAVSEIKVFLASSSELELERAHVGDLFNDINSLLVDTEVRVRLLKWEIFDPAFRGERKQSEYDQQVKKADVFIALFRSKAGMFTMEEVDTAKLAHEQNQKPEKLYCLIQDYQKKREFDLGKLKAELGRDFSFDSFADIIELKLKLIKLIEPYLSKYGVNITETDKFIKISSENIPRKSKK